MLDLAVTGGTVANAAATFRADIGVRDGRVVVLAAPGSLTEDATRRLDATGCYVVPGGIDSHVHFNFGVTEAMRAQSAIDGSRAAAHGGTTTFIDFGSRPVTAARSRPRRGRSRSSATSSRTSTTHCTSCSPATSATARWRSCRR